MKISTAYFQLAAIFEALEKARYEPENDFGANIACAYAWYISPRAVDYLNRVSLPHWRDIKENSQFIVRFEKWDSLPGDAADIKLKI